MRQDDPLAFGLERLRAGRDTYAHALADLEAALPPERRRAVEHAGRDLADAEHRLGQARLAAGQRRRELEVASQRHWGRRDKHALARATRALEVADGAVVAAGEAEGDARRRLGQERAAQQQREQAMAAVAPERAEVTQAAAELDAALDDTRAQRVAVLAGQAITPFHLVSALGDPPAEPAGRQVWCGLAYRIESYRDRHPQALGHEVAGGVVAAIGPRPGDRWDRAPEWDDLAGRLADGPALVAIAAHIGPPGETAHRDDVTTWLSAVDAAGEALEAQGPTVERGLAPERGLSLGW